MEKYNIEISSSAEKSLKKVPKKDISKIIKTIQHLAITPFPSGSRKLQGEEDVYRVRQGHYRIIYEVLAKKLVILVLKIGHRKDIYSKS